MMWHGTHHAGLRDWHSTYGYGCRRLFSIKSSILVDDSDDPQALTVLNRSGRWRLEWRGPSSCPMTLLWMIT